MFHRFNIEVSVEGSRVTFRFDQPVSILFAAVSASTGQSVWQLSAEEFVPVEDEGWELQTSSVKTWPIEDAPPEIIEAARNAEERFLAEIHERGPRKPSMTELLYGTVPSGYRSDIGPLPLGSGEYDVHVFAEQGEATNSFQVGAV
jgi:hypothetical protein